MGESTFFKVIAIISLLIGTMAAGLAYTTMTNLDVITGTSTQITILNQDEEGMLFSDPALIMIELVNLTIEFELESYSSDVIANFHFSAYIWDGSYVHFYIWLDDVIPASPHYRIGNNESSMNVEDSVLKIFKDVESGTHELKVGFLGYHAGNYIFDRNLDLIIIYEE